MINQEIIFLLTEKPSLDNKHRGLIAYYEWVISRIVDFEDEESWLNFLDETHTGRGICMCSDDFFETSIYDEPFVEEKNRSNSIFWFPEPCDQPTLELAIQKLQLRVDKMKEIVQQLNKNNVNKIF